MKRTVKNQKHRANPSINMASENPVRDYFRISLYLPYIDYFINELKERFTSHKNIFEGFLCLFSEEKFKSSPHSFEELSGHFLPEVSKTCVLAELRMWFERLSRLSQNQERRAINLLDMYSKVAYPNIYRLLKIFCSLPVSTATPERSFSTLKRVKNYLRNSTSQVCYIKHNNNNIYNVIIKLFILIFQNRLNGLAMLSIHREIPVHVNAVFDELAKKRRRLDFVL